MLNTDVQSEEFQAGLNKVLMKVPSIFRNFPPEDLRDLLQVGHPEIHLQDEMIIDENSNEIDTAYLIVKGKVSVTKKNIHLANFTDGDFLEEVFLFSRGSRMASIVAQEDTLLLRFSRSEVLDYFKRKPERLFTVFVINVLEIQQRRISKLLDTIILFQKKLITPQNSDKRPAENR